MGARARFGTYSEQQHARNDRIVRDTAPSESVDLHSTARHLRGTIRDLIHRLVLAAGRPSLSPLVIALLTLDLHLNRIGIVGDRIR